MFTTPHQRKIHNSYSLYIDTLLARYRVSSSECKGSNLNTKDNNGNYTKGGENVYRIIDLEEKAERIGLQDSQKIYIINCLKDYKLRKWEDLTIMERQTLVEWVQFVLNRQIKLDLNSICKSTMDNAKNILNEKINKSNFLIMLANEWL